MIKYHCIYYSESIRRELRYFNLDPSEIFFLWYDCTGCCWPFKKEDLNVNNKSILKYRIHKIAIVLKSLSKNRFWS